MTTKRRSSSKRATANRPSPRRSTTKASTSSRKRTSSRRTTSRRTTSKASRKRPATATTLGAAAGTLVVAFLFGAPWSVRIALIVLLIGAGAAYLLLSRRS